MLEYGEAYIMKPFTPDRLVLEDEVRVQVRNQMDVGFWGRVWGRMWLEIWQTHVPVLTATFEHIQEVASETSRR